MSKVFTLAGGITNKVGNDRYFLILDYDNFSEGDFSEIKNELDSIIKKFHLSDATIYKTNTGFHVYFYYDNKLNSKKILEILSDTKKTDENFRNMFQKFFDKNKGVPLRAYGKYNKRDIYFYKTIKGKEPNLLEKSTGDTIKMSVDYLVGNPIVNSNDYKFNVESISPGNEIKTPLKEKVKIVNEFKEKERKEKIKELLNIESPIEKILKEEKKIEENINKTEISNNDIKEVFQAEENIKKETLKIKSSDLYVKEKQISEEKQLWYKGTMQNSIARLINSSLDRKEGAFVTLKDVKAGIMVLNNYVNYEKTSEGEHRFTYIIGEKLKTIKIDNESVVKKVLELRKKQEEEGKDYKYSIDGFIERRPFFMNNHPATKVMLDAYGITVNSTGVLTTPLHFFKSVGNYDIDNAIFSENIKRSSIFNFNSDSDGKVSSKKMKEFMSNNKLDLLESFDFIYDFDTHDGNSTESYDECKKMRDLLKSKNIPFSLNFSGSKGFHIRIPGQIIAKEVPEIIKFIKEDEFNFKKIYEGLIRVAEENNIKIDLGLYSGDLRGLIRVEWSIHPSTGAVVKPLSDLEFNFLEGKNLNEIQKMYKPSVLLKGNKEIGIKKLNLQDKSNIIIKAFIDNKWMNWEEIRDSGKYSEDEWKYVRDETQNPIAKELRALANGTPEEIKKFNKIMEKGEYEDYRVEAPEYIDLMTGRNYNYCRKGDNNSLREFVLDLVN